MRTPERMAAIEQMEEVLAQIDETDSGTVGSWNAVAAARLLMAELKETQAKLNAAMAALERVAYGGNPTDMSTFCRLCGGYVEADPPRFPIKHKRDCILAKENKDGKEEKP